MTLNKKRKYVSIKWAPNGVIGQAAQVAVDRWIPSLGATIRTGGSQDFVISNPETKIAKKNRNILRKVTRYQIPKIIRYQSADQDNLVSD